MSLSRSDIEELIRIARARAERIDRLRGALEAEDYDLAIKLARAVCGLRPADESQPDRGNPPLNR
jgi:hypothetical protein